MSLCGQRTARFVSARVYFRMRARRPQPYHALVVNVVSLGLEACVVQVMSTALKTRYARTLQDRRFFHRGVGRLFLLNPVRQEVIGNGNGCRIKACTPIRRVAVRVIRRVTVLVTRSICRELSNSFYLDIRYVNGGFVTPLPGRVNCGARNVMPRYVRFCGMTHA